MKNTTLIITLLGALAAGILWFAWAQEWIIINLPFGAGQITAPAVTSATVHKKLTIHLPHQGHLHQSRLQREERELLWGDDVQKNASLLISGWLSALDDEFQPKKKTSLQNVALAHEGRELIVSLDRLPWGRNCSTFDRLLVMESLLGSLRGALTTVQKVLLLVHNHPPSDSQLDFSYAWPIEGFLSTKELTESPTFPPISGTLTIMLDPAGDGQRTGRTVLDTFERSITLACAQALKQELEKHVADIRVIVSREPGEILEPLQTATFANRLRTHLFIHLSCHQLAQAPATCALYYFVYNPVTDFWRAKPEPTAWEAHFFAHRRNLALSAACARQVHTALAAYRQRGGFKLSPAHGIPSRPLVGVQAAAICCEIGLAESQGWQPFIEPLVEGLAGVIEFLRTGRQVAAT